MSPANFAYVAKTYILTVELIRSRQAFAIISCGREPSLLVCNIEQAQVARESWIKDVRVYTEFAENPIGALIDLIRDKGFSRARIGLELSYLPAIDQRRLVEGLPKALIVDVSDVLGRERAVKNRCDLAKLEIAAKATHAAVTDAMAIARRGESEKVMADRILAMLIANGADGTLFTVFGSGRRSALTHGLPTARIPKESEIIRLDVGGRFGPWLSDLARTYSTGHPSKSQCHVYRALREIQEETLSHIRPGVPAEAIFFACRQAFQKRRLQFHMPHVGHGLGLELHESPILRPGDTTTLQPGMVLNVEPLALDSRNHLYHIEDLVVITQKGYRLLTPGLAPKNIPIIGEKQHDSASGA